jgi:hypothetical protein
MSRTFSDDRLHTWEAFASGGRFGLASRAKIVFQCVSDPQVRPRYVTGAGDEADAEERVHDYSDDQLREMLASSVELE